MEGTRRHTILTSTPTGAVARSLTREAQVDRSLNHRLTVTRLEDRVVPAGLDAVYFDQIQRAADNYAHAREDVVRVFADQYQQGQQYALGQLQAIAAAEGQVFGDGQTQALEIAAAVE